MGSAMKKNAILERWAETLARRGAVTRPCWGRDGGVLRTFDDIEHEAGEWAGRLGRWDAGTVVGMQVGNTPAWPALVLAAMRLGLIPLPLGGHMASEERRCGAGDMRRRGPDVLGNLRGSGKRDEMRAAGSAAGMRIPEADLRDDVAAAGDPVYQPGNWWRIATISARRWGSAEGT